MIKARRVVCRPKRGHQPLKGLDSRFYPLLSGHAMIGLCRLGGVLVV